MAGLVKSARVLAVLLLAGVIAACTQTGEGPTTAAAGKPRPTPTVSASSAPQPVPVPDSWRELGITAARSYLLDASQLTSAMVPRAEEVMMLVFPPGRTVGEGVPVVLGFLSLQDGRFTRKPADHDGWEYENLVEYGRQLWWMEKRRLSGACPDTEYGCFRWRLMTSSRGLAREVMRQDGASPARGIPWEISANESGTCWGYSTDGVTWTAAKTVPPSPAVKVVTTKVPTWIRGCSMAGDVALVREWRFGADMNGYGTVIKVSPNGKREVFAQNAGPLAIRGDKVAVVTTPDPEVTIDDVQIHSISGRIPPKSVLNVDQIHELGWLNDEILWLWGTGRAWLVNVVTGRSELLSNNVQTGGSPAAGGGHLVYGESIEGAESGGQRLFVLDHKP